MSMTMRGKSTALATRLLSEYSMVLVLLALAAVFSYATLAEQYPRGAAGAEQVADDIARSTDRAATVVIVVRNTQEDVEYADALETRLETAGFREVVSVRGEPADALQALRNLADAGKKQCIIAANQATSAWPVLQGLDRKVPTLGAVRVLAPHSYRWPNFLKTDNLLNIANQIAVIAIIAIGMTMVIITGGIDLSVGSLMALSAVLAALMIRDLAGGPLATTAGMVMSCLAALAVCGLIGLLTGTLVTVFAMPPFIATLAMMLIARGLAEILARGQSIYELPDRFVWLGRGAELWGLPNAVVLMAVLFLVAHLLMKRMTLGRYIYAVGGNPEAARLSGVPVRRVLILVYVLSGALAGLGGVVMASQLKSGSPTYGQMYELYVIAAVVVGGTSLSGGEGDIFGTLIGAFIMAVIWNGMNLTNVESRMQMIVLGSVLLGAVLLDMLKKRTWALSSLFRSARPIPPLPEDKRGHL
jgi:ribose transport system permease protein